MPHARQSGVLSEPRAASLVWLATYLAASGIVLVASGHGGLGALHGVGVVIALWSMTSRDGVAVVVGDLMPLFVAPLLYGEIPQLIGALGTNYHDLLVQRWELTLFGVQPARTLAGAVPVQGVSEVLHLGYLAYYPMIFAPPLLLYVRRERRAFAETVLALTVTFTVCWVLFAAFPVEGPRYLWTEPAAVPAGPMRWMAVHVLAAGSSRGAAFPSSHMAVMVAQTVLAFRWQKTVAWGLLLIAGLVGIGAVYGGFHYASDIVAGMLLGGACAGGVIRWHRAR